MRSPGLSLSQLTRFSLSLGVFLRIILTIALLFVVGLVLGPAYAQTPPSLSFNATFTQASGGQVIPSLTWSTTPAATSCTASGDTAWTGTKAASGSLTLAAVTPPKSYTLVCTWSGSSTTTLTWEAPTTNTDGSALAKCAASTDTGPCLAKYRICRGASATALTDCRDHNFPQSTSTPWSGTLTAGTHFFGIKAVTGQGVESAMSNVVSKVVSAPFEVTQSVGVKVPASPSGLTVE